MSTETTPSPETNTPETNTPEKAKAGQDAASRAAFATAEDAQKVKPSNARLKLFVVTKPGGGTAFTWGASHFDAVVQIARHDGYKASTAGKAPDKAEVAGMLAQLTPEERDALLAQYAAPAQEKPAEQDKPAAQPAKARGKGK